MPNAAMIAFEGVEKSFPGAAQPSLKDVSFSLAEGGFLAVVGASGSGKTTLLKCVNRLVTPDRGEVRVGGEPVAKADPIRLRRGIGHVFQAVGLFPHMTVGENIAITPALLGWTRADREARALELLDLVALPRAYAERFPDTLSGGERQRVGVARALAARPKLLLMDEPFGALDPVTRDELGRACRALHDQLGLTTLMVTHDAQEALLLADRILVMQAGRVTADGTPRALLRGEGGAEASALLNTPRRQAERIRALLGEEGRPHG